MKGLDAMVNTNYALQKKKKKGKKQIMQFFVEFIKCIKKGLLQKKTNNRVSNEMKCYTKYRMKHTLIIKRTISFLQQPHNK